MNPARASRPDRVSLLRDEDRRALEARWGEPQRVYHTVQHLRECLDAFAELGAVAERPDEVEAAIWLHDAIYDPRASDNEERSADLARAMLAASGTPRAAIERVAAMILATRHDRPVEDPDAQLLCDIDLGILGSPPERFDEYERQVRAEYEWVPLAVYCLKRTEILEGLLSRKCIYMREPFFSRVEGRAQANLARSLDALRSGIPLG